jgi:hypothetical protein
MKNPLVNILAVCFIILTAADCKKKHDEPSYKAEASINGQPWTSNSVNCTY